MSEVIKIDDYVFKADAYIWSKCFEYTGNNLWGIKIILTVNKETAHIIVEYKSEKEAKAAHLELFKQLNSEK